MVLRFALAHCFEIYFNQFDFRRVFQQPCTILKQLLFNNQTRAINSSTRQSESSRTAVGRILHSAAAENSRRTGRRLFTTFRIGYSCGRCCRITGSRRSASIYILPCPRSRAAAAAASSPVYTRTPSPTVPGSDGDSCRGAGDPPPRHVVCADVDVWQRRRLKGGRPSLWLGDAVGVVVDYCGFIASSSSSSLSLPPTVAPRRGPSRGLGARRSDGRRGRRTADRGLVRDDIAMSGRVERRDLRQRPNVRLIMNAELVQVSGWIRTRGGVFHVGQPTVHRNDPPDAAGNPGRHDTTRTCVSCVVVCVRTGGLFNRPHAGCRQVWD